MNRKLSHAAGVVGLAFCLTTLSLLQGCAGGAGYGEARVADYGPTELMQDDDYVYYPGYEVYYSSRRHHYIYRDGRKWVSRDAPPHVGADVLLQSPSVHVDFHDSPEHHHADVIKSYPKNWHPANRGDIKQETDRPDRRDQRSDRKDGPENRKDDDNHHDSSR